MPFSLRSPFSITRLNFFLLFFTSIINQSFAFSPGLIYILYLIRQRPHLVPGHGAQVRYSLGTTEHTLFSRIPTLEFGNGAGACVQGLELVLKHKNGHRFPVWTQFSRKFRAVHCCVLAAKLMF